jgi:hypothetical protein
MLPLSRREAVVMEGADEADLGEMRTSSGWPGVVPADDINATPARVDGDDVEFDEEGEETIQKKRRRRDDYRVDALLCPPRLSFLGIGGCQKALNTAHRAKV